VQNGGKPFARSWQTTGSALEPPQTAEPRAGRAQDHINSSIQMNKSHQQRLIEARLWKVLALQSSLPRPGMCENVLWEDLGREDGIFVAPASASPK
jgi:hypothetical protein